MNYAELAEGIMDFGGWTPMNDAELAEEWHDTDRLALEAMYERDCEEREEERKEKEERKRRVAHKPRA